MKMTRQKIRRKLNFNQLYNVIIFSFFMFTFLLGQEEDKKKILLALLAIYSTKIQTGPTGKRDLPQKVDQFLRNFSGWTERSIEFWTEISENVG